MAIAIRGNARGISRPIVMAAFALADRHRWLVLSVNNVVMPVPADDDVRLLVVAVYARPATVMAS